MKSLVVFALLLGAAVNASAQVSSHAPTGAAKQPAASARSASLPFRSATKPVARVNGAVLTDRDLLREMLQIFPVRQPAQRIPQGTGSLHPPGRAADDHLRRVGVPGSATAQADRSGAASERSGRDFQKQVSSPA